VIRKEIGPAGVAAGAAHEHRSERQATLFERHQQAADGERRKLEALATLRARHAGRVVTAQRAMVGLLLERNAVTIEDVRAALQLSDGEPARWLGCVPGELRRARIIRRAGFVETRRAVAHARPISEWELADRAAALAWLAANGGERLG
jgi:hypothetical protein